MEVGCRCAHVTEKWVLPEAFRSRVITTPMLLQSDEFPKPMTSSDPLVLTGKHGKIRLCLYPNRQYPYVEVRIFARLS